MENQDQINSILLSQPHIIKGKKVDCKIAIPKEFDEKDTESKENCFFQEKSFQQDIPSTYDFENYVFARKIFVGGLHQMSTENDMFNYFSQFGEVEQSIIMKDKITGKSRGFGFVIFTNKESVDNVINCRYSHYLLGKWIECKRATPKEFTFSKRLYQDQALLNNQLCLAQNQINHDYNYNSNNLFQYQENYKNFSSPNIPSIKVNNTQNQINQANNYQYFYSINHTNNSNKNINIQKNIKNSDQNNFCSNISKYSNLQNNISLPKKEEKAEKNQIDMEMDPNYPRKPVSSLKFGSIFNEKISKPFPYNYFHYKLFDSNGEEVTGLVSSYKNKEKMQLFVEEKKLSVSKITSEDTQGSDSSSNQKHSNNNETPNYSDSLDHHNIITHENIDDFDGINGENCFGPKKRHINCFSTKGFFRPY